MRSKSIRSDVGPLTAKRDRTTRHVQGTPGDCWLTEPPPTRSQLGTQCPAGECTAVTWHTRSAIVKPSAPSAALVPPQALGIAVLEFTDRESDGTNAFQFMELNSSTYRPLGKALDVDLMATVKDADGAEGRNRQGSERSKHRVPYEHKGRQSDPGDSELTLRTQERVCASNVVTVQLAKRQRCYSFTVMTVWISSVKALKHGAGRKKGG
ncbi:hypothetical protein CB1_000968008 [Camelus ferus]|nr:hypothetical protein CB1_000968008 [Camelus ferus]